MAAVLGVNTNTVLRALRALRDEGLLELRQGRGVRVSGTPQRSTLLTQASELLGYARRNGYRREELIEIIEGLKAGAHVVANPSDALTDGLEVSPVLQQGAPKK